MRPQKTKKRIRGKVTALLLILVAAAYLAISAFIAGTIFHTVRKAVITSPTQYGLQYEPVAFMSEDDSIVLKGWFMHPQGVTDTQKNQTIVMLHGSDSNKGNFIMMEIARSLIEHGYNVFSFDFRGNGESAGEMTSLGEWETRDLGGALKYLMARGISRVGMLGYSMGAATALNAAPAHPEMAAIIADSSFANLSTIVDRQGKAISLLAPIFNPGITLMSRLVFGINIIQNSPEKAISTVGRLPIMLIHSTGDDLIPVSEAYALQRAGAQDSNLTLWVAQGKGHVSAFADNKDEYTRRVLDFFARWLHE